MTRWKTGLVKIANLTAQKPFEDGFLRQEVCSRVSNGFSEGHKEGQSLLGGVVECDRCDDSMVTSCEVSTLRILKEGHATSHLLVVIDTLLSNNILPTE